VLTKNAYLEFLRCPQEFWLQQNSRTPSDEELTLHERHLREQDYEVLRLAQKMSIFNGGATGIAGFRRMFETDELWTSADIIVTDKETGAISIYEVKSHASVKPEDIDDLAFQKMAAEAAGYTAAKTCLITVDTAYTRNGHIDPDHLFKVHDVTEEVAARQAETITKTREAFQYLKAEPVPNISVFCNEKLDCGFIRHHFKDIPEYNVTHISRLNAQKCIELLSSGVIDIRHVPADFKLSDNQRRQVEIACSGEPIIDADGIKQELANLKYPLNFLDYESFHYAVPHFHGIRPFQQMVFQYSLHTISAPGAETVHAFHLSKNDGTFPAREVADRLFSRLSTNMGTVIVWNATFEKTRNRELGAMFPDRSGFFDEVNAAVFDLEKIFSKGFYIHPGFLGKTSIKNVLPVLCPDLSYKDLNIGDGQTASIRWYHMATKRYDDAECQTIYEDLCKYCHLDTLAMVEIFNVLANI